MFLAMQVLKIPAGGRGFPLVRLISKKEPFTIPTRSLGAPLTVPTRLLGAPGGMDQFRASLERGVRAPLTRILSSAAGILGQESNNSPYSQGYGPLR